MPPRNSKLVSFSGFSTLTPRCLLSPDLKTILLSSSNRSTYIIKIFSFLLDDYLLESDCKQQIRNLNFFNLKSLSPLAVIGSVDLVKIGNKFTRGRSYEWGTVSIENESHCDFVKFREMLLSTNMLDLIEVTHVKHYQRYRAQRLREIGFTEENDSENKDLGGSQLIHDVYKSKKDKLNEEVAEREAKIKEEFIRKVKEKELEIREMEKEVVLLFFLRAFHIQSL